MIVAVGDILISKINTLPFIDKYAGVVKVLSYQEKRGATAIKKLFPVSVNATAEFCTSGRYKDLVPNSQNKSVLYLEDKGIIATKKEGNNQFYRASYDLVCWLNIPLLGSTGTAYSGTAIASLIKQLPVRPFNSGVYSRIAINVKGQQSRTINPFQKYSYDETVMQFLMYPYDYFVLPIEVEYMIDQRCLDISDIGEAITCQTPLQQFTVEIVDQDGNVIQIFTTSGTYEVISISGIVDNGPPYTNSIIDNG